MQLLPPSAIPLQVIIPSSGPGNQFSNYLLPFALCLSLILILTLTPTLVFNRQTVPFHFAGLPNSLFYFLSLCLSTPWSFTIPFHLLFTTFIVTFLSSISPSLNLFCSLSASFFLFVPHALPLFTPFIRHYFRLLFNFLSVFLSLLPLTFLKMLILPTLVFLQPHCKSKIKKNTHLQPLSSYRILKLYFF